MDKIDSAFFAFAGLASLWLGYLLIREGVRPGWPMLLLVAFWILFTYLLLPRLHRILTFIYVPGYFIGRTRTGDGLLGDPVNLALLGHEGQLHEAMTSAGWILADDLNARSGRAMVTATVARRSYPQAPVSPLMLFDRQQDFAYQQEVGGSTSQRHHVRFWRCPEGWMLPGGYAADWLAAGTYDKSVGFSLFTFQITHKIEANTDIERDFVVSTVIEGSPSVDGAGDQGLLHRLPLPQRRRRPDPDRRRPADPGPAWRCRPRSWPWTTRATAGTSVRRRRCSGPRLRRCVG